MPITLPDYKNKTKNFFFEKNEQQLCRTEQGKKLRGIAADTRTQRGNETGKQEIQETL